MNHKFSNGLIKMILHDTTMKIPIFNTIYEEDEKKLKTKKIKTQWLNNLIFEKVNLKKYPIIKILNFMQKDLSLFETVIVSANDTLVDLFLKKKISFFYIQKMLLQMIKTKEFSKYKKIYPSKITDIYELNEYVRLKILKKVYKSKNV